MTAGYLLDTSVLSVLAPGRPPPPQAFAAWLQQHTAQLYLSSITVAEIEQGICKLRRAGATERANRLAEWLDALVRHGEDRILPLDVPVARKAGEISDHAVAIGRHPGFPDVAIAATAKAHDLVVLTRNGKHFEPLGVPIIDPLG